MNAVTKGNREISELMLTAVTKFRVSFGDLVDMERNSATIELTPPRSAPQADLLLAEEVRDR